MAGVDRVAVAAAALLCLGAEGVARAGNPCADLDVGMATSCQVAGGECQDTCAAARYDASCEVQLYGECSGGCVDSASPDCRHGCEATCTGACAAAPDAFDCADHCQASCHADCALLCGDDAACGARCGGYCAGECDVECMGIPATATCDDKCGSSCLGACSARARFACHMACQQNGYAACAEGLDATCLDQCQGGGAIVCNGQYIAADDPEACSDFLEAEGVMVEGKVQGGGGDGCGVGPWRSGSDGLGSGLLLLGPFLALGGLSRRRRGRRASARRAP